VGVEDAALPVDTAAVPPPGRVYALPQLRPATPDDAREIVALLAAVALEGTLGLEHTALRAEEEATRLARLDLRAACAVVVTLEGHVRGFAIAVRGAEAAIAHTAGVSVAVAADSRRRGCGGLLLGGALAWARAAGVRKLCAGVVDRNGPALALFHRAGYSVEGIRRGQIAHAGRLADEIMFGLQVDAPLVPGEPRRKRTRGRDGKRRDV